MYSCPYVKKSYYPKVSDECHLVAITWPIHFKGMILIIIPNNRENIRTWQLKKCEF